MSWKIFLPKNTWRHIPLHKFFVDGKSYYSPTYNSWKAMLLRCYYTAHDRYSDYGAKGITVSDSWLDFNIFLQDMGCRPSNCTLDRINNLAAYEKNNCRWATKPEQQINRRPIGIINYRGVSINEGKYIRAIIHIGKIQLSIGNFKTIEEAAQAYDKASWEWFGNLEVLNFPDFFKAAVKGI